VIYRPAYSQGRTVGEWHFDLARLARSPYRLASVLEHRKARRIGALDSGVINIFITDVDNTILIQWSNGLKVPKVTNRSQKLLLTFVRHS